MRTTLAPSVLPTSSDADQVCSRRQLSDRASAAPCSHLVEASLYIRPLYHQGILSSRSAADWRAKALTLCTFLPRYWETVTIGVGSKEHAQNQMLPALLVSQQKHGQLSCRILQPSRQRYPKREVYRSGEGTLRGLWGQAWETYMLLNERTQNLSLNVFMVPQVMQWYNTLRFGPRHCVCVCVCVSVKYFTSKIVYKILNSYTCLRYVLLV